jgi:hypothetical protein
VQGNRNYIRPNRVMLEDKILVQNLVLYSVPWEIHMWTLNTTTNPAPVRRYSDHILLLHLLTSPS